MQPCHRAETVAGAVQLSQYGFVLGCCTHAAEHGGVKVSHVAEVVGVVCVPAVQVSQRDLLGTHSQNGALLAR